MPRINQAFTQPVLIAGCEPIPLTLVIVASLLVVTVAQFAFSIFALVLPIFIAAIIILRKCAEYDPKLFAILWDSTMPGIKATLKGTRGVGTTLWDLPTAISNMPLVDAETTSRRKRR